jgi:rhodanese-related sulfurtransferase
MTPSLSPHDALALVGARWIDIRSPDERASDLGFLPGSVGLLPGESCEECLQGDQDAPVLLYCTSGRRSLTAAQALQQGRSGAVFSLQGGVLAWQEAGSAH